MKRSIVLPEVLKMCRSWSFLLVIFGAAHTSQGWNAEGHMVVAQIAYNHLDASVKSQCDALIAVSLTYANSGTTTFVTAACWADDFKSSLGTGIWHYIDQPFSLDGTSTSGVSTASFDVVRAIRQCEATLQTTTETQTNKATALRYLIHFVGDIHQPLHCSTNVTASDTNGDAGGNSFPLSGTYSNLHSLWDAGGGQYSDSISRPLTTTGQNTLNSQVSTIETAYPFTSNAGTIPDPQDWADEGLELAETVSYVNITRNSTPTTSYLNTAKATARERAAMGGHRLADVLNTIFASNPVTISSFTVE